MWLEKLLLVIDQSESMLYEYEGKTLLEHAKEKASDLITHLEPGDAVSLILAGEKLETPFQAPTSRSSSGAQAGGAD